MKRATVTLAFLGALVAYTASAHGTPKHTGTHRPSKLAAGSLTGEVVDTGCYLGHSARGKEHVGCAKQCLAGGMPMGLVTSDGTLYLITMNHENPDAYNRLKDLPGQTVTVTGMIMTRGGMKGIDVTSIKSLLSAAPPRPRANAKPQGPATPAAPVTSAAPAAPAGPAAPPVAPGPPAPPSSSGTAEVSK